MLGGMLAGIRRPDRDPVEVIEVASTTGTVPSGKRAEAASQYLVRTEVRIDAGHAAEFERRQIQMAEDARGSAGFVGGSLLRSYSHPTKFVVTSSFDSVETAWAFGDGDALPVAARGELAGAATVTQQEGYELVHEALAEPLPQVGCEILIDEVLKGPEVIPAFEATLGQLFELRRTHSHGYGYNRLFRSGGRLGRYLVIQGYSDLSAAGAANTPEDVQAFIRDHPADLYTDKEVSPEAYAVIAQVQRSAASPAATGAIEAT